MDAKVRKEAIGKLTDYPHDHMITYLAKNAEIIFEPKRVLTANDWLHTYKEPEQSFNSYRKERVKVTWISQPKNKLYLFMMDSFTDKIAELFRVYAKAFFPGAEVRILR